MRILLANDDGIYAPGLAALQAALSRLGEVVVVAPATEQSGVGHSITYLTPLTCKQIFREGRCLGWAVDGAPADCVKLGVLELAGGPVDLVVSGINSGLNAGINVLYSGTVAAAIEGAFFGIPSIAVSLEYDPQADFEAAAEIAIELIPQLVDSLSVAPDNGCRLFNINIPTAATAGWRAGRGPDVHAVPMGIERHSERYWKRQDPKGRDYYWSANLPAPRVDGRETDMDALAQGLVTVTPLHFDMTQRDWLARLQKDGLRVAAAPPAARG
jgi:5'-nucleotidase